MEISSGLHSGERQVAAHYEQIRADHRLRYEWACQRLPVNGFGADVFCGNGYGTWLISQQRFVVGIDGCADAIDMANRHYKSSKNLFCVARFPFDLPEGVFDYVVALESIEHVQDSIELFAALERSLKPGGQFIFSVPCEDYLRLDAIGNPFHFKHFGLEEVLALGSFARLSLLDFCGQDTYQLNDDGSINSLLSEDEMILRPWRGGQFVIVHATVK